MNKALIIADKVWVFCEYMIAKSYHTKRIHNHVDYHDEILICHISMHNLYVWVRGGTSIIALNKKTLYPIAGRGTGPLSHGIDAHEEALLLEREIIEESKLG